ncbi:MAG TPA: MerR family transcriptional regulator [Stellaceae bacterium]|nr:MerR family transcriptional regulator [Stellaceae bacterium]
MSDAAETPSGRRANKRAAVFRTIGEVAEDLDLPAHVLRFWESKFPQLKPLKRGGGRRYYRPEDIALLSRIRQYLYQEGYTIRGVQKLLSEGVIGATGSIEAVEPSLFPLAPIPAREAPRPARSARRVVAPAPAASRSPAKRAALEEARRELTAALEMLGGLVRPKS